MQCSYHTSLADQNLDNIVGIHRGAERAEGAQGIFHAQSAQKYSRHGQLINGVRQSVCLR